MTAPTTAKNRSASPSICSRWAASSTTPGALAACKPDHLRECLGRHVRGDWGVVCAEDRKSNFEALFADLSILSAYPMDPARPCKGFGVNTL
jgi:hypothetical protein